ncbi:uncharacterized protein LOC114827998 [Galendromus occidentalis]|uniref:Uncharacterized protein LOC114827998 n=1 Tax=Galendromus occidentalis TaxID=34638 RepID=A0AAJ7SEK1_9ACAR|nr:uncharacterized protein LOC114827998 [Galendromus occidentalis]
MDDDHRFIEIRDTKEFAYTIKIPRKYDWAVHDGPNSSLCDLTLELDDGQVSVHSDVFCHFSQFFKAMFSATWLESKTHRVHFPNIEYRSMRALVDMIYAGEFLLTHYNIEPIFQVVHHLQMDELLGYCCDVLIDSLEKTNVIAFHQLAARYTLGGLREECVLYVLENCKHLFEDQAFLAELPFDLIETVMQRDDLFVKNELDVLTMILSWLQVETHRDANKIALFEKVRFPQLNTNCKKVLKALTPLLVESTVYTDFCKSRFWLDDIPRYQLRPRKFQPVHLHYVLKVNYVQFGKSNRAYALFLYCNISNRTTLLHSHEYGKRNSYNSNFGPHEYGDGFTVVGRFAYLQERMILREGRREFLRITRTSLQPNKLGAIQTQNIYFPVADQSLFQVGKLVALEGRLARLHVTGSANRLSPDELREIRTSLNVDRIKYGLDNINVMQLDLKAKKFESGPSLIENNAQTTEPWLFALLADRMCKWMKGDEFSFILSSALDGLNFIARIDRNGKVSRISFKPDLLSRRTLRRGIHDMLLIENTLFTYEYLDIFNSGDNQVRRRIQAMDARTQEFTGIMVIDCENNDATAKLLFSICEMDVNKLELCEIRGEPHLLVVPNGYQLGTKSYFGVFQIMREMAENGDSLKVRKVRLDKLDIDEFQKMPEDSCVKIESAVVPVDMHPCEYSTFIHDQLHRLADHNLSELEALRKFAA